MDAAVHILIVDDDPNIRALLSMALCAEGRHIRDVPDGLLALEALRASAVPLIVLLDWQMPQLDGPGVLRAVAAEPRLARMHRFVLITASDAPGEGEAAALLCDLQAPVIRKPFDLTTLFEVVDDLIAR